MKQDDTMQDGLDTLERNLGPGGAERPPEDEAQDKVKEPSSGENSANQPEVEKADAPPRPPAAKKSTPVFVYLAVMFAAAFLMLLLAYFIQERNNAVQIGNLQSAMENFQSIDELMEENRQLRSELQNLQKDHSALREQYGEMQNQLTATQEFAQQISTQHTAALYLFTLENLMREERYAEAAEVFNAYQRANAQVTRVHTDELTKEKPEYYGISVENRLAEIAGVLTERGYWVETESKTGQDTTPIGTAAPHE